MTQQELELKIAELRDNRPRFGPHACHMHDNRSNLRRYDGSDGPLEVCCICSKTSCQLFGYLRELDATLAFELLEEMKSTVTRKLKGWLCNNKFSPDLKEAIALAYIAWKSK